MLVMGNDGQPLNRLVSSENATKAAREICLDEPREWLTAKNKTKLVLYFHGGLNSEEDSFNRTQIMGPWFEKNDLYPIFVTWKTGWMETLQQILQDSLVKLPFLSGRRAEGLGDFFGDVADKLRNLGDVAIEKTDRTLELASERLAKPLWSQMKQNAEASADAGMGIDLLAKHLRSLRQDVPGLEIHLVGHSAGSLVIGHLLDKLRLGSNPVHVSSLTLYAPACSLRFALAEFRKPIEKGILNPSQLKIDVLSDANELDDSIGPYRKSLLYLVSRALEIRHKTPLLGMEREWTEKDAGDKLTRLWGSAGASEVREWREFVSKTGIPLPAVLKSKQVSNGVDKIQASHGSFDNNVDVVNRTLQSILGSNPLPRVDCLAGF